LVGVIQFILAILAIPVVGWISAALAAVIIAALIVVNRTLYYFLNDILQDERGAGWMWTWGFGSQWIFRWFYVSFGAWRDWGWFVLMVVLSVWRAGGSRCHLMR